MLNINEHSIATLDTELLSLESSSSQFVDVQAGEAYARHNFDAQYNAKYTDQSYPMKAGVPESESNEDGSIYFSSERSGVYETSLDTQRVNKKNFVRFDNVQVRIYDIILGDNPSVTSGLPWSLGWVYLPAKYFEIDIFENERAPPVGEAKKISRKQREAFLQHKGYTKEQLDDVSKEINFIKAARRRCKFILNDDDNPVPIDESLTTMLSLAESLPMSWSRSSTGNNE